MKFKLKEDFTIGQEKYFKDSVIKYPCYRTTRGIDTKVFSCVEPEFFSPDINYSKEYAEEDENPITYDVYLNITNPFCLCNQEQIDLFNNEYLPWARENNPRNYDLKPKKLGDKLDLQNADYIYHFLKDGKYNYDGLIVDEGITWNSPYKGIEAYVPFYSNQIKLISNLNPTSSDSIDS